MIQNKNTSCESVLQWFRLFNSSIVTIDVFEEGDIWTFSWRVILKRFL